VNNRIYKAHLLKESFGQLWSYTYKGAAKRFWDNWKEQLKWQRLGPYKKFAKMIVSLVDGIIQNSPYLHHETSKVFLLHIPKNPL
jgi:hypothetical protein